MNKSYLLIICLLLTSFTGCVELFEEDLEEEEENELENALYTLFKDIENGKWESYCKMFLLEIEDDTIILANETQIKVCVEGYTFDTLQLKHTINDYKEEETDKTIASNSGPIYEVTMDIEFCVRYDSAEPWDCETVEDIVYFTKVSGRWIDVTDWVENSSLDLGESAPIATFFVEEDSAGVYHVTVAKVSKQEDLAGFSFFLKDWSGSTYVGGNGFGEIAMQIINGEEHGIQVNYEGDDEQLKSRADNVSNDDGSEFPVHFSDNDRDGKLSSGDQFLVYGKEAGPAEDGWKLDIQFDATGDIIGSAKLGEGGAGNFTVYGCMRMNATNYNEDATEDDGSCVYPVEECELVPYGHCSDEDFGGQDLSEMDLTGIDLSGANLTDANLAGANLSLANLAGAHLNFANLNSADLTGASLLYAVLTDANLSGADLTYANLNVVDLMNANLTGADLQYASLYSANLQYANLTGANLANASLYDAYLYNAWLYNANLTGANLAKADLTYAYLRWADLTDANLTSADLFEARLIGAVLKRADLTDADLTGANLVYGWLGFADFTGAIVTDVDFTYAYWEETIWTDGVVYDCTGLCDSPS